MVLMRNDAFEKREQILKLRMKVLKVEQERMDGVNTLSLSEVRKKLSYRMNKSWKSGKKFESQCDKMT